MGGKYGRGSLNLEKTVEKRIHEKVERTLPKNLMGSKDYALYYNLDQESDH